MENKDFFGLPENEKNLFQKNYRGQPLPVDLEDNVVAALRQKDLLGRQPLWRRAFLKPAFLVLAALMLFFSGVWFGTAKEKISLPADGNPYLLLLYNPPGFDAGDTHAKEYGEWFRQLKDKAASGEELKRESWQVSLVNSRPQISGQRTGNGTPSGFFIIRAASDKEALATAATCPHVKHQGLIAVQPIQPH